jgi:argininosuccinate synthase
MNNQTAVIAYSGGLDTTFCIPYLREQGYAKIITVTVNTGGYSDAEIQKISATAKQLGVDKHVIIDAQTELYETVIQYIIKANYQRMGQYPTVVGGERTLQAIKVAEVAKAEKADVIVHGSTKAGNDQVRFDVIFRALAPEIKILAPVRDHSFSRKHEAEYLLKHGVEFSAARAEYSVNVGLLGATIGGAETLDTVATLPRKKLYELILAETGETTEQNFPEEMTFDFEKGRIKSINQTITDPLEIIAYLNQYAFANQYGFQEFFGATIVGLKARIGFLAPAIQMLIATHSLLEKIILTSEQIQWKDTLATVYGNMIHEAKAINPLTKDIEAFLDIGSSFVTGTVKAKIVNGHFEILNLTSQYSLFSQKYSYGESSEMWSGAEATGFCKIYGTESVLAYQTQNKS